MTKWGNVDLWYRVEPGYSKEELIDTLRASGIIIWGGNEDISDKNNVRLGIEKKPGSDYVNVHGRMAILDDVVHPAGTSALGRKIARDIGNNLWTLPKPEERPRYFEGTELRGERGEPRGTTWLRKAHKRVKTRK